MSDAEKQIQYTSVVSMDTDSHADEPDAFSMRTKDGRIVGFPAPEGSTPLTTIKTGKAYIFNQTEPGLAPVINPSPQGKILFSEGSFPAHAAGTLVAIHNPSIVTEPEGDPVMVAELKQHNSYFDIKTQQPIPLVIFFPFALNGFNVSAATSLKR